MGSHYRVLEMVTPIMPPLVLLLTMAVLLIPEVSPNPVGSIYQVFSHIDQSNPHGPHFLPFKPFHLYGGQLPTSRFFSSNKHQLQILQPAEQQNSKLQNVFTNPSIQTPEILSPKSVVKASIYFDPQEFQKLTFNSLDEDFELDFGRNFKYDLHPEEKLSLAFID